MEEEPPLTQVATAATTAAPSDISVTFSQAGPLGIHLGWRNDRIHLLARHGYPNGIKPGTQAEQHPQLRAGLVVTSVNGTSTVGMALRQILELSKASGRPLVMTFAAAAPAKPKSAGDTTARAKPALKLKPATVAEVCVCVCVCVCEREYVCVCVCIALCGSCLCL